MSSGRNVDVYSRAFYQPVRSHEFSSTVKGVKADTVGNVIVALENNLVLIVDKSNEVLITCGTMPTLSVPQGILVMPNNQLAVSEAGNHRITIFQSYNECESPWDIDRAAVIGGPGSGQLQFNDPYGIAFHTLSQKLVIADYFNRRLQILSAPGRFLNFINSTVNYYDVDITDEYIFASAPLVSRIDIFRVDTLGFIGSIGSDGTGIGQLRNPYGISVSRQELFVCDFSNNRIQVFNVFGDFLYLFSLQYSPRFIDVDDNYVYITGNTASLSIYTRGAAEFLQSFMLQANAFGLRRGFNGNIFTAIQLSDQIAEITISTGAVRYFSAYGTTAGYLDNPVGLALMSNGQLIVAEAGNDRLTIFENPETQP